MMQLKTEDDIIRGNGRLTSEDLLLRVFKLYDIGKMGAIEHSTLVIALRELGISSCLYTTRRVLEEIDLDKCGKIEFQDFRAFFAKASNSDEVKDLLSNEALKYMNYMENVENGDSSFANKYRVPDFVRPEARFEYHLDVVQWVSWLSEREFCSASLDGSVAIWEVSGSKPLRQFKPTEASIYTAKIIEEKKRLAVFGYGESQSPLNLVDLESGKVKIHYAGIQADAVTSLDSDDQYIVSGSKKGGCFLHDLNRSERISTLTNCASAVESVSIQNSIAAVGDHEGHVSLVDLRTDQDKKVNRFEGALGKVSSVLFSHSEHHLFVGGDDFVVRCFDTRRVTPTGGAHSCYLGHTSPITSLGLLDGEQSTLLSGSLDGSVRMWPLGTVTNSSSAVKFSNASEEQNQASIDDTPVATKALIGHSQAVKCIAARPNGHILTASSDTSVLQYIFN